LNEHGQVATGAMSNIFWVKNRMVYTPSADCGCRKGIVRRWILEKAGVEHQEVAVSWDELLLAEEIFVTNSRVGILPVHDFEGHAFPTGKTTRFLQESYSACLASVEE
jgi:branched-subunit amino acid aminotransferase/4-amino-4-deoxychorismate lyase